MARRTRRSPRRRPARRPRLRINLLPAGLALLAIWLVVSWGRATVLPGLVRVGLSEQRAFEVSSSHRALVVRTEWAIPSGAEGKLRILVDDGKLVPTGTVVARVASEQEHDRIQAELERVTRELDAASQRADAFLREVGTTRATLLSDLLAAAAEWARVAPFRCLETEAYLFRVMSDIDADIRALDERARQEQEAVQSLSLRHQGLGDALDRITTSVVAPATGAVCWLVDGLEGVVTTDWLRGRTPDDLLRLEPRPQAAVDGMEVTAGQRILRLVDTYRFSLGVPVSVDQIEQWPKGTSVTIRVAGREISASSLGPVGGTRAGQQLVRLEIDRDLPSLIRDRFVDIEVITLRTYGVVVPARAIIIRDGVSGVYLVDRSVVRFVPVAVVATAGTESLVSGLAAGSQVVFSPKLVWEGMTLP